MTSNCHTFLKFFFWKKVFKHFQLIYIYCNNKTNFQCLIKHIFEYDWKEIECSQISAFLWFKMIWSLSYKKSFTGWNFVPKFVPSWKMGSIEYSIHWLIFIYDIIRTVRLPAKHDFLNLAWFFSKCGTSIFRILRDIDPGFHKKSCSKNVCFRPSREWQIIFIFFSN